MLPQTASLLANASSYLFIDRIDSRMQVCNQSCYCMQSAMDVWQLFKANFLKLWDEQGSTGDAYPEQLFGQSAQQGQAATKVSLLLDPSGFLPLFTVD